MKEFHLAPRHISFNKELEKEIQNQPKILVRNLATPEARKLYEMHSNVARALCKIKSFLRFDISKKGILYSKIESEHKIEDLILKFFHQRFPLFIIAIQNKNRTYIISKDGIITESDEELINIINNLEKTVIENNILKDLENDTEIWEKYYDSQFIPERKNHRLMRSLMPKKYMFNNQIEQNTAKRCKKLTEF